MGLRIIAVMPSRLRLAMEQILEDELGEYGDHKVTGLLNQGRYQCIEGFNLATFVGNPDEEQLNLSESVVFSFDAENHHLSAKAAVLTLAKYGVLSEIRPGPPPVEDRMSIVVITDYPWFRLAFHPPASQMPD